jgi:hypothetical protein
MSNISDEAVLSVLYGILAEDEDVQGETAGAHRQRRSSFHLLFGDELKACIGQDGECINF